jgi:hypothetical protein
MVEISRMNHRIVRKFKDEGAPTTKLPLPFAKLALTGISPIKSGQYHRPIRNHAFNNR